MLNLKYSFMTKCHQFSGQSLLVGSKNTCLEIINDLQIHRGRGGKITSSFIPHLGSVAVLGRWPFG